MSHSSTLQPFPIDMYEPPTSGSAGAAVLRCVQSRLARPPKVQLEPLPTALNRRMQKACTELQILIGATRRLAIQQANRELILRAVPGQRALLRLQVARAAWDQQWNQLMERLDDLQDELSARDEPEQDRRDRHTVAESHRLIESIRHWALGFRTGVAPDAGGHPFQDSSAPASRLRAGSTRKCQ